MEKILSAFFSSCDFSAISFISALIFCFLTLFALRSPSVRKFKLNQNSSKRNNSSCVCSCNLMAATATVAAPYMNGGDYNGNGGGGGGGGGEVMERAPAVVAVERQTGASMMEQLVPEITTHALSYLDYQSLCRLSMTNSSMRKAANDDNAWKALYHKDFTLEQDSVTPVNGWKAYYAATRAILSINAEFFNIIRERQLPAMGLLWFNADYVKCVHASGELFSGYNAVMESWQLAFNWEEGVDFQIRDVRARVLTDMAWVTMQAYVDMETGPFNVTNAFEFHNGRWYMVHYHSSVMLIHGGAEQQMALG